MQSEPLICTALLPSLLPAAFPHPSQLCSSHPFFRSRSLVSTCPAAGAAPRLPQEEDTSLPSPPRLTYPPPPPPSPPRLPEHPKLTHMEERLSWGEVPRQPKLQSSRSGSGWGEAQRGTPFISARCCRCPQPGCPR